LDTFVAFIKFDFKNSKFMKHTKSLVFFLAAFFIFLLPILAKSQEAKTNFRKAPYLIYNANPQSMVILWQLNESADCQLLWSDDSLNWVALPLSKETDTSYFYKEEIELSIPFHRYFYTVKTGSELKQGSFMSRPKADLQQFTFYAYGDTRTFPQNHNEVAGAVLNSIAQQPLSQTFIVSTGDVVANGNHETDWDQQFFNPAFTNIQKMLANLPYLVSMGNHEGQGQLFGKYFPFQFVDSNHFYYSFDYGNARFIALDQFASLKTNSTQYQWLVNQLKASNGKWIIILLHKPGYSAGGHGNDKVVQKQLQPLFEQYGVKLVLTGHNHYYARALVNGVTHITTGGGGAPLYDPDSSKKFVLYTEKTYHFCRINVSQNRLVVDVIRADGSLIESFDYIKPNL